MKFFSEVSKSIGYTQARGAIICSDKNLLIALILIVVSAWCDCKSAPKEGEVTCRDTLFPVSDSVPHQSLRQHAMHGVAK